MSDEEIIRHALGAFEDEWPADWSVPGTWMLTDEDLERMLRLVIEAVEERHRGQGSKQ